MRLLTRVRADSALRRWGLALKKRLGFKRAAVAVARKMAVALHAMRVPVDRDHGFRRKVITQSGGT
jgi:hypothetical protein